MNRTLPIRIAGDATSFRACSAWLDLPFRRCPRRCSSVATRSPRDGFTLIEVLAASLLMVLMTSAILVALRSSYLEARQLRDTQSRYPSTWMLKEQIRRDVQNAQGMQAGANVLQLYGFLATAAVTRMPTLQQALVTYRLSSLGEDVVLIREEQPVGAVNALPPRRDVVWKGVHVLNVRGIGGMTIDSEEVIDTADTAGLPAIAPMVKIVLEDDSNNVLMRETIVHHQEN